MTARRSWALVVTLALVGAACADDGVTDTTVAGTTETSSSTTTSTTTTSTPSTAESSPATTTTEAPLTASFRGVTADAIKVGIAYADFEQLKELDLIDFTHGDEVAIWQALIDDLNSRGGINGRVLEPVYDTYLPVGNVEAEESCVKFTEDEEVFAVLGLWVGESVLCLTALHDTIHVGHLVRQEWIDRSLAVLATPDTAEERQLEVFLTVLRESGRLDGRNVGVLTDHIAEGSVTSVVEPFFAGLDASLATVGVLEDNQGDEFAIARDVERFTEQWRIDGIDLLLVVGNNGLPAIPDVLDRLDGLDVATSAGAVLQQVADGGTDDEKRAYDGVLTLSSLDRLNGELFDEPGMQRCVQVVEAATGHDIVHSGALGDDPHDWAAGVSDACGVLEVFALAGTAAGTDLTNDTFRAGLEGLGQVDVPGTGFASFGPDKYDGNDGFRLVALDPFAGEDGAFVPLGDLIDTAAG